MKSAILLHAPWPAAAAPAWAEPLLVALPYAWRLELERRALEVRLASLGGLALTLCAAARLCGTAPAVRELARETEGKPRFVHGPYFSVSHCATRIAALVTQACEVGLDLEAVGADVAPHELQRWTAIEAALKAAGLGLRAVQEVELATTGEAARVRGRRYGLVSVQLAPGVITSVAAEAPLRLVCAELDFEAAELSATLERSLGLAPQL